MAAVVRSNPRAWRRDPSDPFAETVKRVEGGLVRGRLDRAALATAQTPAGGPARILEAAYSGFPPDGPETCTDEAALLEACSIPVHVVPGDPKNLKVTVPEDLARAEAAFIGPAAPRGADRVGSTDGHPFGPGPSLALGGIMIEGAPRLHGHSDGDVALHALADALLGAAGLGDLGRLFPADAETPAGIASEALLGEVVAAGRRRPRPRRRSS